MVRSLGTRSTPSSTSVRRTAAAPDSPSTLWSAGRSRCGGPPPRAGSGVSRGGAHGSRRSSRPGRGRWSPARSTRPSDRSAADAELLGDGRAGSGRPGPLRRCRGAGCGRSSLARLGSVRGEDGRRGGSHPLTLGRLPPCVIYPFSIWPVRLCRHSGSPRSREGRCWGSVLDGDDRSAVRVGNQPLASSGGTGRVGPGCLHRQPSVHPTHAVETRLPESGRNRRRRRRARPAGGLGLPRPRSPPRRSARGWAWATGCSFTSARARWAAAGATGRSRSPVVRFPDLSCEQWAEVAAEAGMRYAVLTVKHHDGFCLWPTEHTAFSVASTSVGDVVRRFVEAFRAAGVRPGFYYSLWDANYPGYADDDAYAAYVQAQVRELHEAYGPAVEWWFDGDWDKAGYPREQFPPYAGRSPDADLGARWRWRELYALIHGLSPESIVLLNPGATRPGEVLYTPVDARTALYFDFVHQDRIVPAPEGPVVRAPGGRRGVLAPRVRHAADTDGVVLHRGTSHSTTRRSRPSWAGTKGRRRRARTSCSTSAPTRAASSRTTTARSSAKPRRGWGSPDATRPGRAPPPRSHAPDRSARAPPAARRARRPARARRRGWRSGRPPARPRPTSAPTSCWSWPRTPRPTSGPTATPSSTRPGSTGWRARASGSSGRS